LMDDFSTVPILKSEVATKVENSILSAEPVLKVFPNPIQSSSTLEVQSDGQAMRIDLLDMQGKRIRSVFSGVLPKGKQQVPWSTQQMPSGTYVLHLRQASRSQSLQLLKL